MAVATFGMVATPATAATATTAASLAGSASFASAFAAATAATPPTLSYPGGDLVTSVNDGGISPALMSQYLSTNVPQALGLPAGASLSNILQATYNKTKNTPGIPSSEPPPTFSGGTLSVSGSTVTADIPAASVQAVQSAAAEPPNGIITGPAGLCMHVSSASAGTPVDLQACDGSQSQHFWLMTDGTIQIYNECLTVGGTANSTPLVLSGCNGGGGQQWTRSGNTSGTLKNPASGRCIDDPSGSTTVGTRLQLYDCNGNAAQNWNWPGTPLVGDWIARLIGAIVGGLSGIVAYGLCLAVFAPATFDTGFVFAPAVLGFCGFIYTFMWTFTFYAVVDALLGVTFNADTWKIILVASFTAGLVSGLGAYFGIPLFLSFPVFIRNLTVSVGNAILALPGWIGNKVTTIVDTVKGWFSTAATEAPIELPPILETLGLATPGASGPITSGISGKCVDAFNGGGTVGTAVNLNACNGNSSAQTWTVFSNGNVGINGECLDATGNGTANGTKIQLGACDGTGGEVWQQKGNELQNPQSNRCLDDPGGTSANNTQLQLYDCIGGAAQAWSLPGSAGGGGGGGGGGAPSGSACDIYAFYGTPCEAAYSTTRALYSGYSGPLYQVQRASDGATTNIGLLSTGGDVNASEQNSFCGQFTCIITEIFDQSSNGNNLFVGGAGGQAGADRGAVASLLPVTIGGNQAYGVDVTPGVGYRQDSTRGIAVNGQAEGMYMVASGTHVNSGCCFDFGNAETNNDDNGNGHMDAVTLSTTCFFAPCSGSGPWVAADMENGLFQGGNGSNTANTGNGSAFVTAMLGNNGQNNYQIAGGNAQSGGLSTWYNGALPNIGGYSPMHQEGGITLGVGGDNSNSGVGSFFEGVMTSGEPAAAANAAVQANVVAAGYGGNPNGYATGGSPLGSPITMTANASFNGGTVQCVDVYGNDTGSNGTVADVWNCQSGAVDQYWTHNPNGSLETMGRCLDIDGDGTAPGTKVELWDCNNAGGQVWQQQPNGSLYNPQSGLCLDDPSGSTTNGTVLQIWTCLGNAAQQFLVDGFTPTGGAGGGGGGSGGGAGGGSGQSTAAPAGTVSMNANGAGQCVDDTAGTNGVAGTVVDITSCDGAPEQYWTHNPNGTLTTLGLCLDIDGNGTAPGTKVELWTCNGVGGQVWQQFPDGSLRNPQSGLCLDDPSGSTVNGTGLQIWNCLGNQAQKYTLNGGSPIPMLANNAGQCIDVLGNDNGGDGTVVDVWSCLSNAVDQHWVLNSNGSLETLGRCLDIDGNGTAPGTKVELWDCNGVGGQVWQPQPNGELYNPQSGLCLDDPSGSTTNGTGLQIWNCLGNQAQNYAFGY